MRRPKLLALLSSCAKASSFGRRTPEDGRLDWAKPARQLHNLVRAVTDPWPGAYSFAGVSKFIVWKSRVRDDIPAAKPGTRYPFVR